MIKAFIKISCLILLICFTSCIKTPNEKAWNNVSKKGGKWHVDKMVITSIVYATNEIEGQQEFTDVGDFTFLGEAESGWKLNFDGNVQIHPSYPDYFYGPFEIPIDYFGDTEFYIDPGGFGTSTFFKINYLSKKKLNLFVPRANNPYYFGPYEFTFYFECSRK